MLDIGSHEPTYTSISHVRQLQWQKSGEIRSAVRRSGSFGNWVDSCLLTLRRHCGRRCLLKDKLKSSARRLLNTGAPWRKNQAGNDNVHRNWGRFGGLFVVRHVGSARLDTLVSTRSTRRTYRVVSRNDVIDEWNLGFCVYRYSRFCVFNTDIFLDIAGSAAPGMFQLRWRTGEMMVCLKEIPGLNGTSDSRQIVLSRCTLSLFFYSILNKAFFCILLWSTRAHLHYCSQCQQGLV